MKKIVFAFVLITNCIFSQDSLLRNNELEILGNWLYSYSFNNDTNIFIKEISINDGFGKLPKGLQFKENTIKFSQNINDKSIYYNLICNVITNSSELITYPKGILFTNSDSTNQIAVTLYTKKNLGLKVLDFYITKIDYNLLFLSDERYYKQDNKTFSDFIHVYVKN